MAYAALHEFLKSKTKKVFPIFYDSENVCAKKVSCVLSENCTTSVPFENGRSNFFLKK